MSGGVLVLVSALCLAALSFGLVSDVRRDRKRDADERLVMFQRFAPATQAPVVAHTQDPWRMTVQLPPPAAQTAPVALMPEAGADERGPLNQDHWRMTVQLPPPAAQTPPLTYSPDMGTEAKLGVLPTGEPKEAYEEATRHLAIEGAEAAKATAEHVVWVAAEITKMAQAAVETAQAVKAAAEQIARAVPPTTSAVRVVTEAATMASLEAKALEEAVAKVPETGTAGPAIPNWTSEAANRYMRGVA